MLWTKEKTLMMEIGNLNSCLTTCKYFIISMVISLLFSSRDAWVKMERQVNLLKLVVGERN